MVWRIYGATSTGEYHVAHGEPCADFVGIDQTGPVKLAVLLDGAGSVHGSSLFAQTLKAYCLTYFQQHHRSVAWHDQQAVRHYLQQFYQTLHHTPDLIHPRAGDSTLLIVLVTPTYFSLLQVGDGFCVVQKLGHLDLISAPNFGEYVNETEFVKGQKTPSITITESAGIEGFFLSSDGLASVAIQQKPYAPHAPFFTPFMTFLKDGPPDAVVQEELQAFLDSKALHQKVKDDLSLIVGYNAHG